MSEEKTKKKKNRLVRAFVIAVTFGFIMMYSEPSNTTSTTSSSNTPKVNHYNSLQEAYDHHKNYIRHVCQEWVKIIDPNASGFSWPSYAGEYMGKFIVKGTSNGRLFRCEYIEYENERGMNLDDVRRE